MATDGSHDPEISYPLISTKLKYRAEGVLTPAPDEEQVKCDDVNDVSGWLLTR